MSALLKIDKVLKEKNILQKDLAKKIGVSKVSVSYWCNNQTSPSLITLSQIAKALKVKMSDLIND
jgi:transcriptional regulator with XRE-family HTH domain